MSNKKANFLSFLFGLVLGNKGIPIAWHSIYIIIILILLFNSKIFDLIFN